MKAPNIRRFLLPFLSCATMLGGAYLILRHELRSFQYDDMIRELKALPPGRVLFAAALTVISYAVLTGYDALALRYVGRRLPYRKIALASFTGYAVSNNLGFPLFTGAPVRARLYSAWGITPVELAKVIAFYTLTFWIGFLAVGGVAFIVDPIIPPDWIHPSATTMRLLGCFLLVVLAGYMTASLGLRQTMTIRGIQLIAPRPALALQQVLLSSADWLLAAGVAYILLPPGAISYPAFVGLFLFAQVGGLLSHVPGGIGVFEAIVIAGLPNEVTAAQTMGSLLLFRAVYYLAPLALAIVALLVREAYVQSRA